MTVNTAVIHEVVWQFAENCSALWEDRERAARAALFPSTLADLEQLDSRIDAQLDGLRVSEPAAWRVAAEALELQGGGEFFVAAVLAFERESVAGNDPILVVVDAAKKPAMAVRPISVALDWISPEYFAAGLDRLTSLHSPLTRAVSLIASANRGLECGSAITSALQDSNPMVIQAGCWAAARLGRRSAADLMEPHLTAEDEPTRAAAARYALLLGSFAGMRVLKALAADPQSPSAEASATALFRCLNPVEALSAHRELFGDFATRASVRAAASAGIPELVPHLLDCLSRPQLSRLAAEAFSEITGVDLQKVRLTMRSQPETDGPTESPLEENTELDPDEGLPWPDNAAVNRWWADHNSDFTPLTRYLAGAAANIGSLRQLLANPRQRRRVVAAELLACSGLPLFDVCAPAFRQAKWLTVEGDAWR